MWGWILHFTPASVLSLIVLSTITLGILLTILGFLGNKIPLVSKIIPMFSTYALYAKIVGIVLLLVGVWMKGAYDVEMVWRDRAAKIEAKLKIAEEKSKRVNVVIQERVVKEIETVVKVQTVIKERIKEVEKIIDSQCKVDQSAIDILNQAAFNQFTTPVPPAAEPTTSVNEEPNGSSFSGTIER